MKSSITFLLGMAEQAEREMSTPEHAGLGTTASAHFRQAALALQHDDVDGAIRATFAGSGAYALGMRQVAAVAARKNRNDRRRGGAVGGQDERYSGVDAMDAEHERIAVAFAAARPKYRSDSATAKAIAGRMRCSPRTVLRVISRKV